MVRGCAARVLCWSVSGRVKATRSSSRLKMKQASPMCSSGRDCSNVIAAPSWRPGRSEEHTSELQSLMRISYAVFCLKKKKRHNHNQIRYTRQQTCVIYTKHKYMHNYHTVENNLTCD